MHALPKTIASPAAEIVIASAPWWQIVGHHAPSTSGAQNVEDAVHDHAVGVLPRPTISSFSLRNGEKWLHDRPLGIRGITWIKWGALCLR